MIWDYIRDFLVQYIFGGMDSHGDSFGGTFGYLTNIGDQSYADNVSKVQNVYFNIGNLLNGDDDVVYNAISLGDWLSTTTTIIIMCVIVFLFALLVRWIFKAVTSAFLLK